MKRKQLLFAFLLIGSAWVVWAQARASMTAPVIKGEEDAVVLVTQFKDFSPGADYRIGVGAQVPLKGLELELEVVGGGRVSVPAVNFKQGYTSSWWNVPEIQARGFVFMDADLSGKELELKVRVPRDSAEAAGRFFVFVAKNYGSNTWYLEDGSEVNKSHW